ncbi:hypothetical protein J6590_067785 [Homalodisca vitripennis]|nr:hypothetical protein J6590_067785 [Homalodisca vitripennis]
MAIKLSKNVTRILTPHATTEMWFKQISEQYRAGGAPPPPGKWGGEWDKHLLEQYKEKCPFPTRPIREAKMLKDEIEVFYRPTYNGPWFSSDINVHVLTSHYLI